MAGIIPIPTTRISSVLMTQRLTQQVQGDQIDLFRLQQQISTGQRIVLPSDDAPSALRAITLQRLLERKGQLESNVASGQTYLANTDGTLNNVANKLNEIKSATLGVVGTVSSQQERDQAISEINEALSALVGLGNQEFQGRYLFSGSQTSRLPYSFDGSNVFYFGDDRAVRNYSDIGVLYDSNATGQAVFGGISDAVQGNVDLDPELNFSTQLGALRGGRGIKPNGAISISDGINTSIIDLSNAATVADVVRLIEENPPTSQAVEVRVSATGLNLQFASGDNIIVNEVGNGTTARELGILEETGVSVRIGDDLDPKLLKTTSLDDILGSKARTVIESGAEGDNADILLTAGVNGVDLNGVSVQFVDDGLLTAQSGLSSGNEVAEYDASARASSAALTFSGAGNDLIVTAVAPGVATNNVQINITDGGAIGDTAAVSYDAGTKVLTIAVDNTGATTVQTVIDEIALTGVFTAVHDNSVEGVFDPAATIDSSDIGIVQGNTGNSGGVAKTLYVRIAPGSSTANNVISAINTEGTFSAAADLSDSTSSSAAGTGFVNLNASPALTSGGSGVVFDQTSGIRVVNGGETYDIRFGSAETIEDVLNTINSSDAGLVAEINADSTGVNVRSRLSGNPLQIGELDGGQTATQLGIRTFNANTALNELNYGVGVPTFGGFELPTTDGDDITIRTIDNQEFSIDLSGADSISDVVDAINGVTGASVTASAVSTGNVTVVQLVDNSASGSEQFSIVQEAGSLAAKYLGLIPNDSSTQFESLTNTVVGSDASYTDFTITAKDGQTFSVDLSTSNSVGDAITQINNALASVNVTAQLASSGNGIELIDTTGGSGPLTVAGVGSSQAAEFLGLVAKGQTTNSTTANILTGEDRNYLETESVFNTLISLRDALEANDLPAITRAAAKIDDDIDRVTSARAEVGARGRGLDLSLLSLQNEEIQLRSALSEEIDVDLVEAISELTSRQVSLEASLQVSANLLQLTLLNFI